MRMIYQFRRTSKSEAVIPPAMYVRELQMHQTKSLFSSQNYQAKISLTNQCKEEIFWWTRQLVQWNAKQIMTQNPYLVIKPMHLCSGGYIIAQHWCKGEGGGANGTPKRDIITYMQLKAAEMFFLSLVKNKSKINVYLKMDSGTAVSYANKMG